MSGDRMTRIWAQVARQARGAAVSVAHVCAAVVDGVGVDGAGVTVMVSPTVRETMTATDTVASGLEDLQLMLGQGPCVDTFVGGGPVLAVDLRSPECLARWPAFTPAALDIGARAVFALPLQVGAIRLGALDLYRGRPGGLNPAELADALVFADTAGMLLLDAAAGTQPDLTELAWQREGPRSYHAVVHQATGMVLVQLGCAVDAAFARLRAYAYAHDMRLRDVARAVVERRLRFDPDPAPERSADDAS
ncbi:MAG TPA: GAF and ANTAR domain-containing protein [Micromonosporaceae bacterium]|nr:GAF and ANTAR domain-containing protein [Micromonosporaceae bacterium]